MTLEILVQIHEGLTFFQEGLYLGAIGKGDKITCRIKTQDLRYTQAASGTLAVATTPGINLVMWVDHVPQDQAADHLGYWQNRAWRSTEYILEEPSQSVQLTTTGLSPKIRQDTLKDKMIITQMYGFLHTSRSMTNGAYFNFIKLADNAQVWIETQTGQQIFTTNGQFIDFMKYHLQRVDFLDNNFGLRPNFPVLTWDFTNPSIQMITGRVDGGVVLDGLENIVIQDSGVSGSESAVFLDVIAEVVRWWCFDRGVVRRYAPGGEGTGGY